ncbi:MAG TPA: hypothetical protein VIK35_02705, partial [Verrucomicrobiae bacterium]
MPAIFPSAKKNGLGPGALRAGAFGAGNQRERERPVRGAGGGELFVETGHAEVIAVAAGLSN